MTHIYLLTIIKRLFRERKWRNNISIKKNYNKNKGKQIFKTLRIEKMH